MAIVCALQLPPLMRCNGAHNVVGASCGSLRAGCGVHGLCISGDCVCLDGFVSSSHFSTRRKHGNCTKAPDPCKYPVVVHCTRKSRCVDGSCQPLEQQRESCSAEKCGPRQRCVAEKCCCVPGFSGENCTDVDECTSGPCMHGGQCFQSADVMGHLDRVHAQLREGWTDRFVCACRAGFEGSQCQCEDCGAHGSCQADATCACNRGFTGHHCEINVDECASAPCSNNGTCSDGDALYSCVCKDGYTGTNCLENVVCQTNASLIRSCILSPELTH